MPKAVEQTVTVPAGANGLSDAIDMREFELLGIQTPTGWVTTNVTFKMASTLNGTYRTVVGASGGAVAVANMPADSAYGAGFPLIAGGSFLKVNSVTDQTAPRTVTVMLRKVR